MWYNLTNRMLACSQVNVSYPSELTLLGTHCFDCCHVGHWADHCYTYNASILDMWPSPKLSIGIIIFIWIVFFFYQQNTTDDSRATSSELRSKLCNWIKATRAGFLEMEPAFIGHFHYSNSFLFMHAYIT